MQQSALPDERILVVDDEPEIVTLIEYHLANAGYQVATAATGVEAIAKAVNDRPALVVLDVMLPDISGIEVLRLLRATPGAAEVAVLMLTALRADSDRIRGLSLGADDYLTKPFNPEELVLRVGAILRRIRLSQHQNLVTVLGPIKIERLTRHATVNGEVLDLTDIEYRLLIAIIDGSGATVGRGELLREVWGAAPDMHTRTVDVHVQRLRGKLREAAPMVETIRGLGYRLNTAMSRDG